MRKLRDVAKMIDDMLASAKAIDNRTKVRADSRTNALIVEAIPSELSKIKALVERVDLGNTTSKKFVPELSKS